MLCLLRRMVRCYRRAPQTLDLQIHYTQLGDIALEACCNRLMSGMIEISGECSVLSQRDDNSVSHASSPIGEVRTASQIQNGRHLADQSATSGEMVLDSFRWDLWLETQPGNVK